LENTSISLPNNDDVNVVLIDKYNNIYLGTDMGKFYIVDGVSGEFQCIAINESIRKMSLYNNHVLINTRDLNVFILNTKTSKCCKIIPECYLYSIVFGTTNGIDYFLTITSSHDFIIFYHNNSFKNMGKIFNSHIDVAWQTNDFFIFFSHNKRLLISAKIDSFILYNEFLLEEKDYDPLAIDYKTGEIVYVSDGNVIITKNHTFYLPDNINGAKIIQNKIISYSDHNVYKNDIHLIQTKEIINDIDINTELCVIAVNGGFKLLRI
jgi:hypothetical protein